MRDTPTSEQRRPHDAVQHPQVLLVEDNPGDADLVRAALEEAGAAIRLEHVERLEDAIAALRAERFDAVLLDLTLPDALGHHGVEKLRAAFPSCPIVVLTGALGAPDAALRAGAQDYLTKSPLDGRAIERAVAYAIERHRHVERANELAAERAARAVTEAVAQQLERLNAQLRSAAADAREAHEREVAARAEAERRADELEALFASMIDCVIVYGEDARIRAANHAAAQLFGADVRGLTPGELVDRIGIRTVDGAPQLADHMPSVRALKGETVAGERMRIRTPAGERTVVVSSAPLWGEGEAIRGAVSVYRDVTDQDRADAERERLMAELRDTDRRKNQFLAMLSHELRNPLAPIRNSVYILERAAPGGEQARRAQAVIERQALHLTRLVDDLLDVTRISSGKIRLQRERFDLDALVRGTAEDHRSVFAAAGVLLEVHASGEALHVNGDPTRIAQAIGNLLHNAAKFTPRGGRATLSVARSGAASAAVRVRDDGPGLSGDQLTHVFEPFVQGDRTLDRSRGGLGLGLALVKGLVELHGGSVVATSAGAGLGSEFLVTLPLDAAPSPRNVPATPPGAAPVRRVLVIEDNPDAAASLREVLELNDHVVDVAGTGSEGIERARAFRPDVVLCDIGLPEMDGYEVARRIRADPALRSIRLVALSGYASPEDVERAIEAGFDRHLAKPPAPPELEHMLGELAGSDEVPPADGSGRASDR